MTKKIISILIIIAVISGLFWLLSQPPKSEIITQNNQDNGAILAKESFNNPDLIFYWGDGCPHCENVETWLKENNSDNKIKINSKEVYENLQNQKDLMDKVNQFCPDLLQNGGIGVPTAFDPVTQKCIQGDTPIIEFLSAKLTK